MPIFDLADPGEAGVAVLSSLRKAGDRGAPEAAMPGVLLHNRALPGGRRLAGRMKDAG